jgi:electron transport complex protein RnfB
MLGKSIACAGAAAAAGFVGYEALRQSKARAGMATLWQLDPDKCTQCGNCATHCVLKSSAVKCIHAFAICGYCDLCFAYFQPQLNQRNTGAENQLCPVGAIQRTFVEDPYYQYTIDQSLCVGCGKCVKGCNAFGNGSLFLQIVHGDMSFTELLRSQGEEELAKDEDLRASTGAENDEQFTEKIEDLKSWAKNKIDGGNNGSVQSPGAGKIVWDQHYFMIRTKEDQNRLHEYLQKASERVNRRSELFAKYQSQRGQVPRCLNCNECSIAIACPAQAFRRVPADQPYLLRKPKGPAA